MIPDYPNLLYLPKNSEKIGKWVILKLCNETVWWRKALHLRLETSLLTSICMLERSINSRPRNVKMWINPSGPLTRKLLISRYQNLFWHNRLTLLIKTVLFTLRALEWMVHYSKIETKPISRMTKRLAQPHLNRK